MHLAITALALAASAPLAAGAVVLYKHVDPQGRVTYTDQPPIGVAGSVVALDIDTTPTPPPRVEAPDAPPPLFDTLAAERRRIAAADEAAVAAAERDLAAARRRLEEGQASSTADDWIYFGPNNPLGMRRAPRPEYAAELAALEADVRAAETRLEEAQRRQRLR